MAVILYFRDHYNRTNHHYVQSTSVWGGKSYLFGHLGAAQQALNSTLAWHYFTKLLWQTCWHTAAYLHIQETESNISIYLLGVI